MLRSSKLYFDASVKALSVTWAVSGILFVVIVRWPGTGAAWMIWGALVFTAGWLTIGLPPIALGRRVLKAPIPLLIGISGLGGALLIFLPNLIGRFLSRPTLASFSMSDLAWPGMAFAVAAFSAGLYRVFLTRTRISAARLEQNQ